MLDEPTAALDAETEHALFERYAAAARDDDEGRITVLVSHRFSTVRMADLIVVLDGAHVVEIGTHDELMAEARPVRRAVRHPGRRLSLSRSGRLRRNAPRRSPAPRRSRPRLRLGRGALPGEHARERGFKTIAANTPERIQVLKTVPPKKVTPVDRNGQTFYVYADPDGCRCLRVNREEQYEMYQRLEAGKQGSTLDRTRTDTGADVLEGFDR